LIIDPIKLSEDLIRCESVTPNDGGAIDVLKNVLESLGFSCHVLPFTSKEDPSKVLNLYARLGDSGKNFCFAGHTDVVPPGEGWKFGAFNPTIENGLLYGRGTSDMKCAIAAFAAAASEFLAEKSGKFSGSISFLITGDEEALAYNGTKKVLEWMAAHQEKIDACIVGEPTSVKKLGDVVKIGRRGSSSFALTVHGAQGHVAYPHLADNPVTRLVNILHELKKNPLDSATEFFPASNLEVTSIDVGNQATNVIPALATAKFNIRFNDCQTAKKLEGWVRDICGKHAKKYDLEIHVTGEAFITKPGEFSTLVSDKIKKITGTKPDLNTTGGTSDARFIREFCPVIELGVLNATAHKVDENVAAADVLELTKIYREILSGYFA